MTDSGKAILSQDAVAMVRALTDSPTSLRRPDRVPECLWAPRRDCDPDRVHGLCERFPDGLHAAFGALAADERANLVRRLLGLGLRVGVVRPIVTEDLVRRRSGLRLAETSPSRIKGPLPSTRSVLRYHDQSSYANAWYDAFSTIAHARADDAGSLIESFIASWRLFNGLVDNRGSGFDVTDAWVLMRSDAVRELMTRPCANTGSTFLKPLEGREITSPWGHRRHDALPLRRRLVCHLVVRDLVSRDFDPLDDTVRESLFEHIGAQSRPGRRRRG